MTASSSGDSTEGMTEKVADDGTHGSSPSFLSRVLIVVVRGYQAVISPLLGPRCRFYPSCSAYAVQALRERGAVTGFGLAVYRVLRCNPWARGGVDFPPRVGQRWPSRDGVVARDEVEEPDHRH